MPVACGAAHQHAVLLGPMDEAQRKSCRTQTRRSEGDRTAPQLKRRRGRQVPRPSPLPSTELVGAASVSRCCFSLPSLRQHSEVPGTTGTRERPARAGSPPPGSSPLSLPPNSPTLLAGFTFHQPSLQGKHRSGRGGELSASSWRSWSHLGRPGAPCSLMLCYSQCAAHYGLLLQPRNTGFHQNPQNIYGRWIPKEGWTR